MDSTESFVDLYGQGYHDQINSLLLRRRFKNILDCTAYFYGAEIAYCNQVNSERSHEKVKLSVCNYARRYYHYE